MECQKSVTNYNLAYTRRCYADEENHFLVTRAGGFSERFVQSRQSVTPLRCINHFPTIRWVCESLRKRFNRNGPKNACCHYCLKASSQEGRFVLEFVFWIYLWDVQWQIEQSTCGPHTMQHRGRVEVLVLNDHAFLGICSYPPLRFHNFYVVEQALCTRLRRRTEKHLKLPG